MNTDSNTQSNGLFGLLQNLGTAYFGAEIAQAQAQAAAQKNALDSTGKSVSVSQPPATATNWIPGIDNKTVVIGGVSFAALIAAALVYRALK